MRSFVRYRLCWIVGMAWLLVSAQAQTVKVIKFGVLSIAPPSRIHLKWQPFVDYLSTELGQPVEIIVPRGFGKMKQAASRGVIDFFYVNSHVFYRLKHDAGAVGVAQMQNIDGKVTSVSEIFVRADSGIDDVSQLKGKSIAYISPMGAGGYMAPKALLNDEGVAQTREVFTKNLSNSIHKVLLGDIEAATMCGVNYKLMSKKIDTGELKIIGSSEPYAENVIGARAGLDPQLVKRVRDIIVNMEKTEAGRKTLQAMHSMKIARFLVYDPAIESITERLLQEGGFI